MLRKIFETTVKILNFDQKLPFRTMKGHEKMSQEMVSYLVYHFVGSHLTVLKDVKRKSPSGKILLQAS